MRVPIIVPLNSKPLPIKALLFFFRTKDRCYYQVLLSVVYLRKAVKQVVLMYLGQTCKEFVSVCSISAFRQSVGCLQVQGRLCGFDEGKKSSGRCEIHGTV
jgi:hypothetical protein